MKSRHAEDHSVRAAARDFEGRPHPVVVLAWVLAAGLVQATQAPTFRTGTASVFVDALVTDESGRPVPGLTAEDFEILEDNLPRLVKTFDYVEIPVTPPAWLRNPVSSELRYQSRTDRNRSTRHRGASWCH